MSGSRRTPLVILAGPTAVGKTEVAVRLAERLGRAEIISADSRQIYRSMDVGTAKPTPAEQRIPHHLLDERDPDQTYSAGQFARDAWAAVQTIRARGAMPVVVGGAGLYIEALLGGLTPLAEAAAAPVRERLGQQLRQQGPEALYEQLRHRDPPAARRLTPGDPRRVARALERTLLGADHTALTWLGARAPDRAVPLVYCGLARNRQVLYQRIGRRVEGMMAGGLVEEVVKLRLAYPDDCPGLSTLGYAEVVDHLRAGTDPGTAVGTIQQRTRHYAKRQLTWFGRDRRIRWIDLETHGIQGAVGLIQAQIEAESAGHRDGAFSC
jgi:tRNA dimethylallyltransferase